MPRSRKTVKKGGLFGLFTTYKPNPANLFTSSVGTKFAYSIPDKQGREYTIYSKDGKSWSKLTNPDLPGYREFRSWYKQKEWDSIPADVKDKQAKDFVQSRRVFHMQTTKKELTPEEQQSIYNAYMASRGKPNMLTTLGGKKTRKNKPRK